MLLNLVAHVTLIWQSDLDNYVTSSLPSIPILSSKPGWTCYSNQTKWSWWWCDLSLSINTMHSWQRCPEGDIRPEAILNRTFGSSGTASHRSVTLYKWPESSDLDFWFNSTPFWCKNHFSFLASNWKCCKYFFCNSYFSYGPMVSKGVAYCSVG